MHQLPCKPTHAGDVQQMQAMQQQVFVWSQVPPSLLRGTGARGLQTKKTLEPLLTCKLSQCMFCLHVAAW